MAPPGSSHTGQKGAVPAGKGKVPDGRAPAATSLGGLAGAGFVAALAKAARAFTLYDPANAVVRGFLSDYQAKAAEATRDGALVLQVRPFQIVREAESVYDESDREKSLSFRLFRDGVRQLSFEPGVPWEELLRLLEIMAVRYTGVRQQEDDVVTLLRKAEFRHISFEAVEGFVPDEENPEPMETRRVAAEAVPPPTFDQPFPALGAPAALAHREIPDGYLAPLRAEEGDDALAANALLTAVRLLREAVRGGVGNDEVALFLGETRDFLLGDRALEALAQLAGILGALPAAPARDALLRSLGDRRVLDVMLASLGPQGELPPAAARLVPFVPAGAVLDVLALEEQPARRAALLKVLEARLPADADAVIERLDGLDPAIVRGLARSIAGKAPAKAARVAAALLDHEDPSLQVTGLEALLVVEGEVPGAKVHAALRSPAEPVRLAAARLLERRGEPDAFAPLQQALGRSELSRGEAEAFGRALAMVHPARAAALFAEWLRPKKGILQRAFGGGAGEAMLRWAAVSGLGAHPSPSAAALIEDAAAHADDELKRHCLATLARRRAGARHG